MSMVVVEAGVFRKVANYVAASQEIIQKHAAMEEALRARAPKVVDTLASQGLVSTHLKSAKAEEFVNNPVELCEAIEKIASLGAPVKATGYGVEAPVEKSASSQESADAQFERSILGS